jgi:Phosphoenolpyruvate carboxykinase N-terminal domain
MVTFGRVPGRVEQGKVGWCGPRETAMSGTNIIDHETETSLPGLARWVRDIAELTKPDDVLWCDGSEDEWERLTSLLVANGTFTRLKAEHIPEFFRTFHQHLPTRLWALHQDLLDRLG